MYSPSAKRKLEGAEVGDLINVVTETSEFEGFLLPRVTAGDPDCIVLKLSSGYNVGIDSAKVKKIEKLGEKKKFGSIPVCDVERDDSLPDISFIATGGTIGTHVDYLTGGVYMCRSPEEILAMAPELEEVANIRASRPFTMASEDIQPSHWQKLAKEVARELRESDGAIVAHGTDYLHFTSAALSFMLPDLSKPVALVGAQRSPDRGSFDGALNLLCASHYALSDMAEVAVVMHGTMSDDYCLINRGTKVRKMHTSARNAFRPINELPLGKVWPDGTMRLFHDDYRERSDKNVKADTAFEEKVALIKTYVGSDPSIIDFYVDKGYKGLVLEASALGHVPTGESGTEAGSFDKKLSWIPHIEYATENGVPVVIASTCPYGRVNGFVYRNLRLAGKAGAWYGARCDTGVEGHDMLPEVAYIKLGWVLGHTRDLEEAREMMFTNVAGEMTKRSDPRAFLW